MIHYEKGKKYVNTLMKQTEVDFFVFVFLFILKMYRHVQECSEKDTKF